MDGESILKNKEEKENAKETEAEVIQQPGTEKKNVESKGEANKKEKAKEEAKKEELLNQRRWIQYYIIAPDAQSFVY